MTTQSEAWKNLFDDKEDQISDEHLAYADAEITQVINLLSRIGGVQKSLSALESWAKRISEIQSDRQAANRPELRSPVHVTIDGGRITYATSGGSWTAGPNEQTERIREQLEAVYETTTMVKR